MKTETFPEPSEGKASGSSIGLSKEPIELSIVMPCLNEELTLGACIDEAQSFLDRTGTIGEIVIADNGSTDKSRDISLARGARVVAVPIRGYGAALIAGIRESRGTYVIMGDADMSYEFGQLDLFMEKLRSGTQMVVGNRFKGGIEQGAMPPLHRFLGNPVLSFVGRTFFRLKTRDFHCGLRGFDRLAVMGLGLQTTGMEFASEMIVRASFAKLSMAEVPTRLRKDGRDRPPHLRTWTDGWRHLRFLLLYSPRWLFLYPGIGLIFLSIWSIAASLFTLDTQGSLRLAIAGLGFTLVGVQMIFFALMSKIWGSRLELLPGDVRVAKFVKRYPLERVLLLALALFVASILVGVVGWRRHGVDAIDIFAVTGLALSAQSISNAFLIAIATIDVAPRTAQ